jgi:hypothetical protein
VTPAIGGCPSACAVLEDMLATSDDALSEDGVWLSHGKALLRELA